MSLPVSLAVSLSADRALAPPVRPDAAGFGALLMSLRPFPGAAARARVLPVGAGGCRRGDLPATRQRTLLRAGFARSGRFTRAPGGGRPAPLRGLSGVDYSPSPYRLSLGQAAGADWLSSDGAGDAAAGTVRKPNAHALASWLCALWGRPKGAWMGVPCASVRGVLGQALTIPRLLVFGACGRGPLPVFCRRGGCGREDASRTPRRTLLRAGSAVCEGGRRAPAGGVWCLCE